MLRGESVGVESMWSGVGREAVAHDHECELVHRRLRRIVKARGALDAQEAEALRDAERLRIWRHYGYSSLLEYLEMEMGYPPRAALERLRVAKAIVELPAIADAMAQGDLSFSAGRELTRVATADTEAQWLEAAHDKNVRQIEDLVSGHRPGDKPTDPVDTKLRKRRLRYDEIDPETVVLLRQARQVVERELGERIDDTAFLRMMARLVLDGARPEQRNHAPYQVAVMLCEQCKRGTQDGGGMTVDMSPAALEVAMCDAQRIGHVGGMGDVVARADDTVASADDVVARADDVVARADDTVASAGDVVARADDTVASAGDVVARADDTVASAGDVVARADDTVASAGDVVARADDTVASSSKVASRSAMSTRASSATSTHASPSATTGRAKSDIPPALRRKINARDHGRCRVPWCRSSRNLDQHHIVPVSRGGRHTLENLITLCESHHLAHHEGALAIAGTASTATFTRRTPSAPTGAANAFAIAERVVETGLALKALGFDKHEVKNALDKARTHVGTTELSLEQWIKLALSYCPKPRAS